MWFYNLGATSWQEPYALARALAQMGREGAVIAFPKPSHLCVGGEVGIDREIDSEYCRAHGIPIIQRDNRSRAICFAQTRIELQVVLKQGHRLLSKGRANLRPVLSPIFDVCQDLQLDPEYRPPNEILVRGRQIASSCTGEQDGCAIMAASLALEFDPRPFARLLNVQDDTARTRLLELVRTRRTSLREALGWLPPTRVLTRTLRVYLQHIVGGLRPGVIDQDLRAQMENAAARRTPRRARRHEAPDGWSIYIGAGAELRESGYKAPGGFVRASCEWQDGRIVKAMLGGDFFCYPAGALLRLEEALVGVSRDHIVAKINQVYHQLGLVTPGIQPAHWGKVLAPSHL